MCSNPFVTHSVTFHFLCVPLPTPTPPLTFFVWTLEVKKKKKSSTKKIITRQTSDDRVIYFGTLHALSVNYGGELNLQTLPSTQWAHALGELVIDAWERDLELALTKGVRPIMTLRATEAWKQHKLKAALKLHTTEVKWSGLSLPFLITTGDWLQLIKYRNRKITGKAGCTFLSSWRWSTRTIM